MRSIGLTSILGFTSVGASSVALGQGGFDNWEMGAIAFLFAGTSGALAVAKRHEIARRLLGDELDELQPATQRDARQIYAIAKREIGGSITSPHKIRQMIEHNPSIFWILASEDLRRNRLLISGYMSIVPLSAKLADYAAENRLNIVEADITDIPGQDEPVEALYVGGIVGCTYAAKAKMIALLEEKLRQFVETTKRRQVFARAGTEHGRRVIERRDFQPVIGNMRGLNCLYRRDL